MQKNLNDETEYLQLLKLAHQLNGIRNNMKNHIMAKEGSVENSHLKVILKLMVEFRFFWLSDRKIELKC